MNIVAIIPARMAASRFPNKPMVPIAGMPMIGHCYLRTAMARGLSSTYVATCDKEIFDYIKSIGGNAVMTKEIHERATDRTAEAVEKIEKETGKTIDIVAMVQGDEPLVSPTMIEQGLEPFARDKSLKIVNLMSPITSDRFDNPNDVKVVFDLKLNALYFSREAIPSRKKWNGDMPMFKQLGLIFFKKDFLLTYSQMEPTPLEKIESVDMNRVLEHGEKIRLVSIDIQSVGVDVPADLERASVLMASDSLQSKYNVAKI